MVGFKTRGLRNNNPFNIKKSSHAWIGKKKLSTDRDFEQFENMFYGIRAGLKLLVNYVNNDIDTPRKIIERFAPRCENATDVYLHYITHNSRGLSFIGYDERIGDLHTLCCLASRIVRYENSLSLPLLANIRCTPHDLMFFCRFYKLNLIIK